ncbi:hypothetical protein [Streptomyces sp. NBC_01727]|uniref:hypothetical protein n=1 Tax=unclassified Streptomyces TaxID=2593676 RepID=UPI002E0F03A0|nr:hypothetical protein OIE76_03800 [Streptomyces sp. NBC_01727]
MSREQEIVETCWQAYSGFEENDSADLVTLMSPVIFNFPTSLPHAGTFHGSEGFPDFYRDTYDHYRVT